jgi:hypothetical protein
LFGRVRNEEEERDELLSAYLDGELSEREEQRLEKQLSQDPALRAELRAMHRTVSLMRELPEVEAPQNFILSESMAKRPVSVQESRRARPEPRRRAWAAPLLTAATTIVSLLFVVVLAGDLLLPAGGLVTAPAPMEEREAAPKIALEAAPTREARAEERGVTGSASPPPVSGQAEGGEALEEPEMAAEEEATDEEEAAAEATRAAQAPPGAGATSPPAGEEPAEEVVVPEVPTVAPTVTAVTGLTPTIPAEAPVVSEDELGVIEPTPDDLEATPALGREDLEAEEQGLPSLAWRVLEVVLGLASLVLAFATVRAWQRRG